MSQQTLFTDPEFVKPEARLRRRPKPVELAPVPPPPAVAAPQAELHADSPPAPLPRKPRPSAPLGVVEQVRLALRPGSRLAFVLGVLLGAFVPLATFVLSHHELQTTRELWRQPAAYFVAGGLLFSAVTMFRWGRLAFDVKAKALGFVVLLEGTMVTSHTRWLALAALAYLCAINGIATACNLARPRDFEDGGKL